MFLIEGIPMKSSRIPPRASHGQSFQCSYNLISRWGWATPTFARVSATLLASLKQWEILVGASINFHICWTCNRIHHGQLIRRCRIPTNSRESTWTLIFVIPLWSHNRSPVKRANASAWILDASPKKAEKPIKGRPTASRITPPPPEVPGLPLEQPSEFKVKYSSPSPGFHWTIFKPNFRFVWWDQSYNCINDWHLILSNPKSSSKSVDFRVKRHFHYLSKMNVQIYPSQL